MDDCKFINLGGLNFTDDFGGGAIYILQSDVKITKTLFKHNEALNGGAVRIYINYGHTNLITIKDSTFENNGAKRDGGAIQYNFIRPHMENNTHLNNEAFYGPDIGSYPVKLEITDETHLIEIMNLTLEGVASG